jgi:hypothetical protein
VTATLPADTKGNNGEKGTLVITNLRAIWVGLYKLTRAVFCPRGFESPRIHLAESARFQPLSL